MLVVTECKWCSKEFDYESLGGRFRHYCCNECKTSDQGQNRIMYACKCDICGKVWKSVRKTASYCSPKCQQLAPKLIEHRQSMSDSMKKIECKACGRECRVRADRDTFCSRRCHFNWRAANKKLLILQFKYCEGECGKKLFGRGKMCKECRTLDNAYRRLESIEYRCVDCGLWGHKNSLQSCQKRCDVCRKNRIKATKKMELSTPEGCAKRRQAKRNRKHNTRAAMAHADKFSDWQLFSRDRWKCQLCGCKVRKIAGKTNYNDEATVDHIIPLSRGGKHSMANCQTACRACNTLKGAKILGQHRLF